MPVARSENRDKAYEIYKQHNGDIANRKIAELLGISEKSVSGWKCKDRWGDKLNGVLQSNERSTPKKKRRKKGGQPGNKNATGPPGNQNARKHGFYSKYIPKETLEIMDSMSEDPLDVLWMQIQIAYAAIIRSQMIMYVEDKDDKTIEKVEEKDGNVIGERWEVQQAWDKQANLLKAQSRAQGELRNMIKQYEEMLHKHWGLATAEQKARIKYIKAQTEKVMGGDQTNTEDKVAKLFGAIGGALDDAES